MMGSVGLNIDQLQRAAPIVSGFLLGYVAMLPLIGRIADLRGRTPVLVAALVVFAFGSLVTAAAYDLGSLVTGRFLQGVGGGGLVPVTLALVADLYPAERRGVPLGVVGAVQELGSVLGPLYGAVVPLLRHLARHLLDQSRRRPRPRRRHRHPEGPQPRWSSSERSKPCPGGLRSERSERLEAPHPAPHLDWIGLLLLALTITSMLLVMRQPRSLVRSVDLGGPFVPFQAGTTIWFSPLGVLTALLAVAFRRLAPARQEPSGRPAGLVVLCAATALPPGCRAPRHRAGWGHPGLRHRQPRGTGVLTGRSLLPRHRRIRCPAVRAAQPALLPHPWCRTAPSRSGRPGVRCW